MQVKDRVGLFFRFVHFGWRLVLDPGLCLVRFGLCFKCCEYCSFFYDAS